MVFKSKHGNYFILIHIVYTISEYFGVGISKCFLTWSNFDHSLPNQDSPGHLCYDVFLYPHLIINMSGANTVFLTSVMHAVYC